MYTLALAASLALAANAEGPAATTPSPERYSLLFAGPGGPFLAGGELVAGSLIGLTLSGSNSQNLLPSLGSAVLFGVLGLAYQWNHPLNRATGLLSVWGMACGVLAAAPALWLISSSYPGWMYVVFAIGVHAGTAAALLPTLDRPNLSWTDAGLGVLGSFYGFLVGVMLSQASPEAFLGPLIGLAAGGLVARLVDVSPGGLLALIIGTPVAGMAAMMIAARSGNVELIAPSGIAVIALSLGLLVVFLEEPTAPSELSLDRLTAAPFATLDPMGRPRGGGLAVGWAF